jgi:hypothetical protein
MDEKTAELRDIFIDATGSDTVTESQEESHGSLADGSGDDEGRVRELIGRMRERYDFSSDLDDEALETVVRGFHDERDDEDIAADLDVDEGTVFEARMDLHLVRESDRDAPFGMELLRSMYVEDFPVEEIADRFGGTEEEVDHYLSVVQADVESTRASDRFRDGFAELLSDADLAGGLTDEAHEDGLREATEDMETDVSF